MAKIVRDPQTGLSPKEMQFAVGLAKGLNQANAYRAAFNPKPTTTAESINVSASRLAKNPNVQLRVSALLAEMRIKDIDSVGEAWKELLELVKEARDKENFNAAAALMRTRLTGLGALQTRLHVTQSNTMSDEALVQRLSGGDEHVAKLLHAIIGSDAFDDGAARH